MLVWGVQFEMGLYPPHHCLLVGLLMGKVVSLVYWQIQLCLCIDWGLLELLFLVCSQSILGNVVLVEWDYLVWPNILWIFPCCLRQGSTIACLRTQWGSQCCLLWHDMMTVCHFLVEKVLVCTRMLLSLWFLREIVSLPWVESLLPILFFELINS